MKGNQQLILTGSLGDVLRESAQTALSYVRSNAERLGINPDFFSGSDIHIHIPAGATPKEGPSAGVTIALALISLLAQRPARRTIGFTGEITLHGKLLPVAGVREKVLAAHRAGLETVVFPKRNDVDLQALPEEVTQGLKVITGEEIDQLVDIALLPAIEGQ